MPGFSAGTARVRRVLRAHAIAQRTGIPVDEVLGGAHDARVEAAGATRRQVLAGAAATGAALAGGGLVAGPAGAAAAARPTDPAIAIVGAGLAGIRAAHWLWKVKGLRSTVYEADPSRLGGRCWTLRGYFDAGQVVEHGGAFINTDHNAIRNLVNSLGLSLSDINGGNQPPYGDTYWVDGRYSYDEANADWGLVWRVFKDALAAAPYPQTVTSQTAQGRVLDGMTVDQWIDAYVPGGLAGRFGKIMQSNVMAEYGLDPDEQSALNLVYLLGWNPQNSLDPINGADERFGVVGGNDQIIARMVEELPSGTIRSGHVLVAMRRLSNGGARLTFRTGSNRYSDVVVDRAILALPFTLLREVDYSAAALSPVKGRAIRELGLGANGKIHLQMTRRPWLAAGYGGAAYSPIDEFQCVWDDTVGQPGSGASSVTASSPGILCYFPSGSTTLKGWSGSAFGPAPGKQVNRALQWIEPVFPGVTGAYNGLSWRDAWHLHPWSKGAYTCPRPGQYTGLFGVAGVAEGPFHFAGEHTSTEYFGFLNGAVESGERAGKEVAAAAGR